MKITIYVLLLIIYSVYTQILCDRGTYDTNCIVNTQRRVARSQDINGKGKLRYIILYININNIKKYRSRWSNYL